MTKNERVYINKARNYNIASKSSKYLASGMLFACAMSSGNYWALGLTPIFYITGVVLREKSNRAIKKLNSLESNIL